MVDKDRQMVQPITCKVFARTTFQMVLCSKPSGMPGKRKRTFPKCIPLMCRSHCYKKIHSEIWTWIDIWLEEKNHLKNFILFQKWEAMEQLPGEITVACHSSNANAYREMWFYVRNLRRLSNEQIQRSEPICCWESKPYFQIKHILPLYTYYILCSVELKHPLYSRKCTLICFNLANWLHI